MTDCCESKACEIAVLRERQRHVLVTVLWINLVMFGVEFAAGWIANSSALLADSLDMLGDALVYGFSLYVLARSAAWRAGAALLKGLIQAAFGLGVLVEVAYKIVYGGDPLSSWMAGAGALALAANATCLWLLWRHRGDDLNMSSVWVCSRNDVISNSGVLVAAYLVYTTQTIWPDVLVGVLIACLFLRTSLHVITAARAQLRAARVETANNQWRTP